MKQFNFLSILCAGLFALVFSSCENQDIEYPDNAYSTVYFPYQYPVRTIVLGDDTYDTSLDNEHKCQIYATMGGVYANKKLIDIDFAVDNSLCDKLTFSNGSSVMAMPSNYYTLSGSKISLDHAIQGAVGVQLTDAFFADPKALENNYVIPLRMTNVSNADSILSGIPKIANATRVNSALWDIQPKDFVLYCVKFINQWHANYLRRGVEENNIGGVTSTKVRHQKYVEKDEICKLTTATLTDVLYPLSGNKNIEGVDLGFKIKLNFKQDQTCTVLPFAPSYQLNDSVKVYNIAATGTGAFVKNGEKKSWGNKDRNALYLNYNYSFDVETRYPHIPAKATSIRRQQTSIKDTLVVRDRGVKIETFTPLYSAN